MLSTLVSASEHIIMSEAELRYFLHHIFAYTIVVSYFSVRQQILDDRKHS